MGKPLDLLKRQEITFDNHQPGKKAEWNEDLHFHKKMTVSNQKGRKTAVSGVFHVTKNRGVDVRYDRGKEHPKIQNEREREQYAGKIKKEISDMLEKSNNDARVFINRVMENIESTSKGQNKEEITRRKIQAFDSVMDSLGIQPQQKVILRNNNNNLFALYIENQSSFKGIEPLLYLTRWYNRHYIYVEIPGLSVYYVTYSKGNLTMGELTPYSYLKYKHQGFS